MDNDSLLILDSDDDCVNTSSKEQNVIIESSDISRTSTPARRSSLLSSSLRESAFKRKMKKHYIIYSDEESVSDISNNESLDKEESKATIEARDESGSKSESETKAKFEIESVAKSESESESKSESEYESESESDTDTDAEVEISSEFELLNESNSLRKNLMKTKSSKRKDISRDYTKENIKDFKGDISNNTDDGTTNNYFTQKEESFLKMQTHNKSSSIKIESDHEDSIHEQNEVAVSYAKQEIGANAIDPVMAQKRALLCCKLQQLQDQLAKTKLLLRTGNIQVLPDNGERLRQNLITQQKEIEEIEAELRSIPLVQSTSTPLYHIEEKENISSAINKINYVTNEPEFLYPNPSLSQETKELGTKAQKTLDRELALTVERLQDLHGSLIARPSEDEKAEDPKGLKVKLMPHQQHALAWLLWREKQQPPGGVLADDMGLGKTLTMISLIIESRVRETESDSENDEWSEKNKPLKRKGGTLVVCPASLLSQWENEIQNRCKRGLLSVEMYHGNNREKAPKRLADKDVVITTYNILSREFKAMSTIYKVHWKRVILDEAHVVRNHKSLASQAVCALFANKRWALTGTPIQNKELDLYALLKFLKCSPFDDIRVWKRWVDNKNVAGHQRLATVMKTLMLRRTKQELQAKGELETLPDKFVEVVEITLDKEEQLVYEKILVYSRTLFAQFLAQRAEKDHMMDLQSGMYDRPSFLSNPNKATQFTKAQQILLSAHADVKAHEILTLLLRLRQVCCHPPLIQAMLDQEDLEQSGVFEEEKLSEDLISKINNISLLENNQKNNSLEQEDIGVDERVKNNLLTSKNPVFEENRISSKMKAILKLVKQLLEKGDKIIIVSQWTSMLKVIGFHLSTIKGATFTEFTGSVPVKERQGIMDSFNDLSSDPKILLLSLTAGGVGLNLVGGNHLLLVDIHWNPQLETQAQDRIYRFGQKKDVFIYRFICKNTIEERIKHLQDQKLEISQNVLSGDKKLVSKLTLNDLKSLFAL